MKTAFSIAIFFILTSMCLSAQKLTFGAKAGINFIGVGFQENAEDAKGRLGFHFGGMVDYKISEKFSVLGEVLYSQQGFEVDGEVTILDTTRSLVAVTEIDYLNIPILATYKLLEGLTLHAGPQIGFLIRSYGEVNGEEVEVDDRYKNVDISGATGLSYRLKNGLNFTARATFSLSDVSDDERVEVKNNLLQLSVGYFF